MGERDICSVRIIVNDEFKRIIRVKKKIKIKVVFKIPQNPVGGVYVLLLRGL